MARKSDKRSESRISATEASRAISFNLLHKTCGSRLRQQYMCIKEDVPVPREEMAKGYEFAKDQYVMFTPEELKALEEAGTHSADITEFVPIAAVDPVFFDKAYYLAPDKGGAKPYALLAKALRESKRCALGRWAARGKQYIVMIRPVEDGLVMQFHPGSARNHNQIIFERFGPDRGCDIPLATEYTRNLQPLLNAYGNDPRFRLVLFTLDETTYSRELAPLAGHYPALRLGPPWWFNDSLEGMERFRRQATETAGLYNTAGFNDDTRAFPSIPARHDLCRRVDANFLANQVARHVMDLDEAEAAIVDLSYNLARETYRLV